MIKAEKMAGRKPIPDEIKSQRGTLQKCRKRGGLNITLLKGIPPPPAWFNDTAKLIYQDTTNELQAVGILQKIGLPLIVMYCNYLAVAYESEERLKTEGRIITTETGIRVNPLHRISIEAFDSARKIVSEFGITPSSQAKISSLIKPKEEPNPFDEYDK